MENQGAVRELGFDFSMTYVNMYVTSKLLAQVDFKIDDFWTMTLATRPQNS